MKKKLIFLIVFGLNIITSYAKDSDGDGIIDSLDPAPYDSSIPNSGFPSIGNGSSNGGGTVFNGNGISTDGVKDIIKESGIGIGTSDNLSEVILGYVDFFMPYLGIFAFVSLVYAGFLYVTSAANEENADKAKKIIGYVAGGIILVFLSYSIVSLFFNII